jgi:hypothetical protein
LPEGKKRAMTLGGIVVQECSHWEKLCGSLGSWQPVSGCA